MEYLQQLQRFSKWTTPKRNVTVGDLVIIREESAFTTHWPLGRIISVFPGKDGKVRVVQVRTATSTFKRPTVKIALILPAEN